MRKLLALVSCVALAACDLSGPKSCENNPSDPATEQFAPSLGIDLSSMSKTTLGVYRKDLAFGTGAILSSPDIVRMHYSSYLKSGQLIDEVQNQDFTIDLRTQSTIGLADGMLGMGVGGQRLLVVPSALGLGACANGPVPANSTIVYKVELLGIGA